MDIITNSIKTNSLSANEVTIQGFDIQHYFENKLSSAVQFDGVYDSLTGEVAPARINGRIAIVNGIEYIFSELCGDWQEFGNEGEPIGSSALAKVEALSALSCIGDNEISAYAKKSEVTIDHLSSVGDNEISAYVKFADIQNELANAGVTIKTWETSEG